MSAAEKKAMDMEIQRQLAEYDRKHIREIDALVLWELREQLGFGNKRLKKFYDNFSHGGGRGLYGNGAERRIKEWSAVSLFLR